jgi:hypothetical protein
MKRLWSSKLGWCLALAYLALALGLFYVAMTCGGMLCDLAAWPVFVPSGAYYYILYEWLDQWYLFGYSGSPFRAPWLVVPSVITNAGLYYLVGYAIGVGFEGLRPSPGNLLSLRACLLVLLLLVVVVPFVWMLASALS